MTQWAVTDVYSLSLAGSLRPKCLPDGLIMRHEPEVFSASILATKTKIWIPFNRWKFQTNTLSSSQTQKSGRNWETLSLAIA